VLINLAGNAVNSQSREFVEIRASIHKKKDNKLWIRFDIIAQA